MLFVHRQKIKKLQKRMHSSSMHTDCLLIKSHIIPWGKSASGWGLHPEWVCIHGFWSDPTPWIAYGGWADSLPFLQTNTCENITLSQTSFAGSKNKMVKEPPGIDVGTQWKTMAISVQVAAPPGQFTALQGFNALKEALLLYDPQIISILDVPFCQLNHNFLIWPLKLIIKML